MNARNLRPGDPRISWMYYDDDNWEFEAHAERNEREDRRLIGFHLFVRPKGADLDERKRIKFDLPNERTVARTAEQWLRQHGRTAKAPKVPKPTKRLTPKAPPKAKPAKAPKAPKPKKAPSPVQKAVRTVQKGVRQFERGRSKSPAAKGIRTLTQLGERAHGLLMQHKGDTDLSIGNPRTGAPMTQIDPSRLAERHEWRELAREAEPLLSEAKAILKAEGRIKAANRIKLAGEVIFKKDRGGDKDQWAYADVAPSERMVPGDFNFSPKNAKPLAKVLRASLAALGHVLSAYHTFAKIKSARVSPDGNLGGKGYIQKIADMRRQYMNVVEALSALTDTIYDEVHAPHWAAVSRQEDPQDAAQVKEMLGDAEEIREDPEGWAKDQIKDEFGDDQGAKKTASLEAAYWEGVV